MPDSCRVRLADSLDFELAAGDSYGTEVAAFLRSIVTPSDYAPGICPFRLFIRGPGDSGDSDFSLPALTREAGQELPCPHLPAESSDHVALNALWVLLALALEAERQGGLLVHGALSEHRGEGIVLSGRSAEGKSTTSRRLPPPWRSLSDDATLILPGKEGFYCALPWPTRGDVLLAAGSGRWDMSRSFPLRAVFFLTKSDSDRAVPLGPGEALCMLSQTAEQLSMALNSDDVPGARKDRTRRFANCAALVKAVRSYRLYHTLEGEFWKELERALKPASAEGPDAVSKAAPAAAGR